MRAVTALHRLAALGALVIGSLAILAGTPVILGRDPGYYVIGWLPPYNLALGILSVSLAFVLFWRRSRQALPIALGILGLHATVMVVLLTVYRPVVAEQSLLAMTIRLILWSVILILLAAARRRRM